MAVNPNSPNGDQAPVIRPDSPDESLKQPASQSQITPKRGLPAWFLSLLLHTLIFVVLILAFASVQRGVEDASERNAGIVLVNAEAQQTEYLSEGDLAEAAAAESQQAQNPSPVTASEQLPPDLPGMEAGESQLSGTGEDLAMTLPGADSLITGAPATGDVGGQVTTEVFGVEGTGNKFVYVFDRSASMEGYQGRPLMAAKQQLLKSLESLGANHQFQIIFYNDRTRIFNPFGGVPEILFADDRMKEQAADFVQSIRGDRGTDHMNALNEALQLGPDVIFLLTDAEGGFTEAELSALSRRNRRATVINAIEFGVGNRSGSRSIERLARDSGGGYVYKNILTLRLDQ
ncbi:MAG: hypothetical protein AAF456_13495 [Planctomycetota bacterium]